MVTVALESVSATFELDAFSLTEVITS